MRGFITPEDCMSPASSFPIPLPELPEKPLISVIMPSYNYERYVAEAIRSTLEQSYRHVELIVCDDGSTDASRSIVRGLAEGDGRIHLIEQANAGVATALNTAYAAASGHIVCMLDADDLFYPEKLASVVATCRSKPQAGFILHAMHVIDENGGVLYDLPRSGQFEEGWLSEAVRRRGGRWRSMPASALSFRKEVADLLFPMPTENLPGMADAYLYMLAPLLTEVASMSSPLSGYRLHGSNLTGSLQFNQQTAEKFIAGMQNVHTSINAKACPALFKTMPLALHNHLTYREQQFLHALFSGEPRGRLINQYSTLLRLIQADDLYKPSRKLLGLVAKGIAIGLPARARSGWVTWMLGARWRTLLP